MQRSIVQWWSFYVNHVSHVSLPNTLKNENSSVLSLWFNGTPMHWKRAGPIQIKCISSQIQPARHCKPSSLSLHCQHNKLLRMTYCHWPLEQHRSDVTFVTWLLVTSETGFRWHWIFDYNNSHFWAENNPHGHRVSNHQCQCFISMCLGIIWDDLLGSFKIQGRLNSRCIVYAFSVRWNARAVGEYCTTNIRANMISSWRISFILTCWCSVLFWIPVFLNSGLDLVNHKHGHLGYLT